MGCRNDKYIRDSLARLEGQIRGIGEMISCDREPSEVLAQIAACRGALARLANEILKHHVRHELAGVGAGDDGERRAEELVELFVKHLK